MTSVAVVIPFYQRSPGVLDRSLKSVFAQDLPTDTMVRSVITDDDSPIALDAELATITAPAGFEIVALRRANGGPGAARNTSLDSLDVRNTDFVAFLDSDDIWKPRHLADGLAALSDDADFYFCDHERWHNADSWFVESKSVRRWLEGQDDMFAIVPGMPDIMEFAPGRALLAFLVDYLAQTSTVIYRFSSFVALRFDAALRHAGEDNMFWLDLANKARAVRFSRRANVATGEGVNMYFSSLMSWDHPDAARRIGYNVLFLARATNRFGKVRNAKAVMHQRYWAWQKEFAWVSVRKMVRDRNVDLSTVLDLVRERKSLAVTLPLAFAASIVRRPQSDA